MSAICVMIGTISSAAARAVTSGCLLGCAAQHMGLRRSQGRECRKFILPLPNASLHSCHEYALQLLVWLAMAIEVLAIFIATLAVLYWDHPRGDPRKQALLHPCVLGVLDRLYLPICGVNHLQPLVQGPQLFRSYH